MQSQTPNKNKQFKSRFSDEVKKRYVALKNKGLVRHRPNFVHKPKPDHKTFFIDQADLEEENPKSPYDILEDDCVDEELENLLNQVLDQEQNS
ncbi:hypothetical protein K3495_g17393 [Podosphaera aphanis]|nr:hypothetical protein K3495_g17393 [Podosphaera aphanis]